MTATELVVARVAAGDIGVGDRVARQPSQDYREVVRVHRSVVTVRLYFADGSTDWPRVDASWWRELAPGVAFAGVADSQRDGPTAS